MQTRDLCKQVIKPPADTQSDTQYAQTRTHSQADHSGGLLQLLYFLLYLLQTDNERLLSSLIPQYIGSRSRSIICSLLVADLQQNLFDLFTVFSGYCLLHNHIMPLGFLCHSGPSTLPMSTTINETHTIDT